MVSRIFTGYKKKMPLYFLIECNSRFKKKKRARHKTIQYAMFKVFFFCGFQLLFQNHKLVQKGIIPNIYYTRLVDYISHFNYVIKLKSRIIIFDYPFFFNDGVHRDNNNLKKKKILENRFNDISISSRQTLYLNFHVYELLRAVLMSTTQ
jgi:hypothetical protein